MSDQQRDWRPPVGARVLIKGDHPAAGNTGHVVRHDTWLGKLAVAVVCDNGLRPGVQRPEHIQVLEESR